MKARFALIAGLVLTVMLPAAAKAEPCQSYSRTVSFADGSHRMAQGTACMDDEGVYRVTEEHLAPLSAPLPPDVYYAPPVYAPAPPPYYYPPYAYYDPWYDPWYRPYYGPSLSFGFVFGDHHHHHHH